MFAGHIESYLSVLGLDDVTIDGEDAAEVLEHVCERRQGRRESQLDRFVGLENQDRDDSPELSSTTRIVSLLDQKSVEGSSRDANSADSSDPTEGGGE